jgi:hypothetical protein
MYAVLDRYHYPPEQFDELTQQLQQQLIPQLRRAPGFVAWYWLNTGTGESLAMSLYETQAHAEAAEQLTTTLVEQSLSQLPCASTRLQGDVPISAWCSL